MDEVLLLSTDVLQRVARSAACAGPDALVRIELGAGFEEGQRSLTVAVAGRTWTFVGEGTADTIGRMLAHLCAFATLPSTEALGEAAQNAA
jgi:hypothetical protein